MLKQSNATSGYAQPDASYPDAIDDAFVHAVIDDDIVPGDSAPSDVPTDAQIAANVDCGEITESFAQILRTAKDPNAWTTVTAEELLAELKQISKEINGAQCAAANKQG